METPHNMWGKRHTSNSTPVKRVEENLRMVLSSYSTLLSGVAVSLPLPPSLSDMEFHVFNLFEVRAFDALILTGVMYRDVPMSFHAGKRAKTSHSYTHLTSTNPVRPPNPLSQTADETLSVLSFPLPSISSYRSFPLTYDYFSMSEARVAVVAARSSEAEMPRAEATRAAISAIGSSDSSVSRSSRFKGMARTASGLKCSPMER